MSYTCYSRYRETYIDHEAYVGHQTYVYQETYLYYETWPGEQDNIIEPPPPEPSSHPILDTELVSTIPGTRSCTSQNGRVEKPYSVRQHHVSAKMSKRKPTRNISQHRTSARTREHYRISQRTSAPRIYEFDRPQPAPQPTSAPRIHEFERQLPTPPRTPIPHPQQPQEGGGDGGDPKQERWKDSESRRMDPGGLAKHLKMMASHSQNRENSDVYAWAHREPVLSFNNQRRLERSSNEDYVEWENLQMKRPPNPYAKEDQNAANPSKGSHVGRAC
jgi:hypothetical protein